MKTIETVRAVIYLIAEHGFMMAFILVVTGFKGGFA